MMPKTRKPATCNWPTTNSPSRSPASGNSGSRIASMIGAISASVPPSRNSTKMNGGASASASFIKGQLPAQETTVIAR
jgi:hypothetical protein